MSEWVEIATLMIVGNLVLVGGLIWIGENIGKK